MNWQRGLFRFWCVLSALWVGGFAIMFWQDYPSAPIHKYEAPWIGEFTLPTDRNTEVSEGIAKMTAAALEAYDAQCQIFTQNWRDEHDDKLAAEKLSLTKEMRKRGILPRHDLDYKRDELSGAWIDPADPDNPLSPHATLAIHCLKSDVEARNQWLKSTYFNPNPYDLLEDFDRYESRAQEHTKIYLALAAAPPIFLLVLGLAGAWVVLGFSQRRN